MLFFCGLFAEITSRYCSRRVVSSMVESYIHTDATSMLKSSKLMKKENSYSLIVYACKITLPLTVKLFSLSLLY